MQHPGACRVLCSILVTVCAVCAAHAQVVRQLTDVRTSVVAPGALDDAGAAVFAGASADLVGTNPSHSFQLYRFDPTTGAATQVTAARKGAAAVVAVRDDGQWIAFPSPADLIGANHDESVELFLMAADGSRIVQLTDDPSPNAGSVGAIAYAGSGGRIAFLANTDPLGGNPENRYQLFVIDSDGSDLEQLTSFTAGTIGSVSISDDGSRIVFAYDGDPTGGNPDVGTELFAIAADGTGLRQLTSTPSGYDTGSPSLSGNGARIAFQSNADLVPGSNLGFQDEIFVIDWAGTGLRQVTRTSSIIGLTGDPASQSPSITDDGLTIVYHSNHGVLFPPVNLDGNFEIFRIRADGTGRTALTSSLLEVGNLLPTASGNGTRISYYGIDTTVSLEVADGSGGNRRTLASMNLVFQGPTALSPDGSRAVFVRSSGLFGSGSLWSVEADGSGLAEYYDPGSGSPSSPSIAADAYTTVFVSSADPTGGNPDGSSEVFRVNVDGTGLAQLTAGATSTSVGSAVVAAGGAVVVYDADADPIGGNADASRELFAVAIGGGRPVQLTSGPLDTVSRGGRVDASGTWVVFESNADLDGGNPDLGFEVWRVRTDGTGLERLTGDPVFESRGPDIAGTGDRVVYSSSGDPLGTNPEGNAELFALDLSSRTNVQLTSSVEGSSGGAAISGDGAWVYFSSDAPFLEDDPDRPSDLYRVPATGGAVERAGALRSGATGALGSVGGFLGGGGSAVDPSTDGERATLTGVGDPTGGNLDALPEVWLLDRAAVPSIEVSKEAPTVVTWSVESGPLRYDVVRGDVGALAFGTGGVDLGAVVCLENDSPDSDTVGSADAATPASGQAFFYVLRGSAGLLAGPGSYGVSSSGAPRIAASGDCAPGL